MTEHIVYSYNENLHQLYEDFQNKMKYKLQQENFSIKHCYIIGPLPDAQLYLDIFRLPDRKLIQGYLKIQSHIENGIYYMRIRFEI
jgi:hypothetical protein